MNTSPQLHVILGTGPLGLATARALLARGRQARMVNRSGKAPTDTPAGVEVVAGNVTNAANVRELCAGATAVYQCAQPAYHEWVDKFPSMQTAIIEGVAATGAKLVVAENLYMYGPVDRPMTEDLPYAARNRKGSARARMAEQVLAAHREGALRATAGRGSDFFGPGVLDSTMGERVFIPALQGNAASAIGNLDLPHTYTYIDDFGAALAILGERPEADGQAWHVPNAPAVTQRAFITQIFNVIGAPPKMSGMGGLMMRLGGLFIPAARETVEMMYEFERPFVVDSRRFETTFGMQATPLADAISATVAWYKHHWRSRSSSQR